jgi:hypothetical protein
LRASAEENQSADAKFQNGERCTFQIAAATKRLSEIKPNQNPWRERPDFSDC